MKIALLFSGQGTHEVNMVKAFANDPSCRELYEQAQALIGDDLKYIDTAEGLKSNRNVQLSLYLYHCFMFRKLKKKNIQVDMVAGHSIGAFAAAYTSGVLSFEKGLEVVELRGRLMEKIYSEGYGMAVVIGLDRQQVIGITDRINEGINEEKNRIYVANINSNLQLTLSGKKESLKEAIDLACRLGAQQAKYLNVTVPSHCRLMDEVGKSLKLALEGGKYGKVSCPYAGNVNARLLWNKEMIIKDLYMGVSKPVQWFDMATMMYERGTRLFIEVTQKPVLSNLCKSLFDDVRTLATGNTSVEDIEMIAHKFNEVTKC